GLNELLGHIANDPKSESRDVNLGSKLIKALHAGNDAERSIRVLHDGRVVTEAAGAIKDMVDRAGELVELVLGKAMTKEPRCALLARCEVAAPLTGLILRQNHD